MNVGEFKVMRGLISHGGTWRGVADGWTVFGGSAMTQILRRLAKRGWIDERQESGRAVFTVNAKGRAKFKADARLTRAA